MLTATTIGDGVAQACAMAGSAGVAGRVVGAFSCGFYVRAGGTIFAVGGPTIPAGPIHLVLATPPPSSLDQTMVWLQAGRLEGDGFAIDLSQAARYRPHLPSPAQLRAAAPWLASLDERIAVPDDIAHVWAQVRDAVAGADLCAARHRLQGLGSGLTPTGDDVLAGLLLFACWADPDAVLPGEVARVAATTELSRCFLAWAAAGQSIEPVHDIIDAAIGLASAADPASGPARDRLDRAVARVAAIGGTSGRALLAGLGLAAAAFRRQAA